MSSDRGNGGVLRSTEGRGRLYQSIVDTVGDTPVVRVNRLAPEHVAVYVKCEFFNPAASVKDRLALNIIEAAERDGTLEPGQTVVEATSGNTGVGLAMVCAAKGYPLVVTMADSFSTERRQLMRILGAKVVLTPRALKGHGMYMKAKELAEKHGWFLARQFETPANADIHESTTAREIIADFEGGRLDYFVSGYGTGGTVAGVGRVLKTAWPEAKIVLSEPANAQLVGSGIPQARSEDGGPAVGHSAFEPHPIQGWTPDFIPLVLQEAIDGHYYDELIPIAGRRRHEVGAGAGGEGGDPDRHLRRRDLRRRHAGRRDRARGVGDPRDAARHRRALPLDPAVRALRGGDERGGARDHALDPGLPDGLTPDVRPLHDHLELRGDGAAVRRDPRRARGRRGAAERVADRDGAGLRQRTRATGRWCRCAGGCCRPGTGRRTAGRS